MTLSREKEKEKEDKGDKREKVHGAPEYPEGLTTEQLQLVKEQDSDLDQMSNMLANLKEVQNNIQCIEFALIFFF